MLKNAGNAVAVQDAGNSPQYESPRLSPIGNLHDVVAATTQNLLCDGPNPSGDGPLNTGC
jgi:hypothetical protein